MQLYNDLKFFFLAEESFSRCIGCCIRRRQGIRSAIFEMSALMIFGRTMLQTVGFLAKTAVKLHERRFAKMLTGLLFAHSLTVNAIKFLNPFSNA